MIAPAAVGSSAVFGGTPLPCETEGDAAAQEPSLPGVSIPGGHDSPEFKTDCRRTAEPVVGATAGVPAGSVAMSCESGGDKWYQLPCILATCKVYASADRQDRNQVAFIAVVSNQADFAIHADLIPQQHSAPTGQSAEVKDRVAAAHDHKVRLAARLSGRWLCREQRRNEHNNHYSYGPPTHETGRI